MKRTNKITLTLQPLNGGAFHCLPGREVELSAERITCDDVTFPWEGHPHNMRLWVIGNEYGALGAVWASHEQDALDELVDQGLGDGLLVDESSMSEAEREDLCRLGNACEAADLANAWIQTVRLDPVKDSMLCIAFAEARGSGASTLDDVRVYTNDTVTA